MKTKLEIKTTEEIASPNMTSFHVTAEWEKYVLKRWVSLESLRARDAKIREVLELALLISANTTSWTKLQEKIQEALLLLEKEGVNSEK